MKVIERPGPCSSEGGEIGVDERAVSRRGVWCEGGNEAGRAAGIAGDDEPRALRVMNGRGRVGMKGRPAGWKAGPEHCGEPSPADCERYEQRRARAASACGERVYAASACGERRGLSTGARG